MPRKLKTTTIKEEIPEGNNPLLDDESTEFDLDIQRADDVETVNRILTEAGIPNVIYRFYDNDGGYCYSSPDLDYDRARRETKGGKSCKLGVFVGGKIIRMVPFPLSPVDPATIPAAPAPAAPSTDMVFLKELVLKMVERQATPGTVAPAPSLADLTTALANLDTLRGNKESAMDHFQKGIKFAESLTGKTDWKTDAIRTVSEIAPQIMGAFQGRGPVPGGPLPVEGQPPVQLPPDSIIKAGIAYLKKKSATLDPEFVVEWIYNNGEEFAPLIDVVLNKEFADVVQFDPEIGREPYVSWFKPVFDGLRSAFKRTDPMDDDPGRDSGNVRDIRSHGESGANGGAKPAS